jgi:mRNA-degrading endonuclease toxin of MazEF toxin-antitoxin module
MMIEPGELRYAVIEGGLGHDQGNRPVVVIGRRDVSERVGETLVLPISHVEPDWDYPLSWEVPADLLPHRSWVLISRPRAAPTDRLPVRLGRLDRDQMDEVQEGLRQLIAF